MAVMGAAMAYHKMVYGISLYQFPVFKRLHEGSYQTALYIVSMALVTVGL